MPNSYFYSNIASPATLSGNIDNSVGSCTVSTTAGWPSSTPYIIAIDFGTANEELVRVTNNASGTLTIVRAFGGTSAVSHSSGAAVRHVYNAQDATDFRTHEAATAAVHGIVGSFVGTTDTQTLTNKTLTTPSITGAVMSGGGSMAGTFTGTPTFNGAIVLSGTPNISNGAALSGTFSGAHTYSGTVTMSGTPSLSASGEIQHTNLYRGVRAASTDSQWETRVTGDANARFFVTANGEIRMGPGNTSWDTQLYRKSNSVLATDDTFLSEPSSTALDGLTVNLPVSTVADLLNLRVDSSIQAAMDSSGQFRTYGGNSPTTYTPTWSNAGSATFTTNTGYHWRLGKLVFVVIYAVVNAAGSGSGIVGVTMPTNVDRSARQALTLHGETIGVAGGGAGVVRIGAAVFLTTGSGASTDRLRVDDRDGDGANNVLGSDLMAGSVITIQGWYREA